MESLTILVARLRQRGDYYHAELTEAEENMVQNASLMSQTFVFQSARL